ncbi:hypothetical protein H4R33_004227 [Dimargaris cristalligena]|uniref:Pentacotripeptide-repeat region of PRORP domain-containing protein n=1 Tax=Dimargaris cristalligena TaxID=215637 RepID=A0A4P9ZSI2_9FUNG|nr:hypothetical protein H4R33_004227 [Dimargaris cristalligena]RKP35662.1 hypothetical protein BJ085DRAFT_39948 [Dimargaris cristalligena]|eukprot:RKP35662.1 hypothetical protein BJ085DRAFT_39948 [Dimargaris cristalligena]
MATTFVGRSTLLPWRAPILSMGRSLTTTAVTQGQRLPRTTSLKYSQPKDAYLLSAKVTKFIKLNKLDDAIALTMNSPGRLQSPVVWNLLIFACSEKGALNRALKLYNQIKKRGLRPDSHTYTALLRCCAQSHSPRAVAEADKVYEYLQTNQTPSLIHSNAMLRVYARHGRTDEMIEFYRTMPPSGNQAPDEVTYTITMQAMAQLQPQPQSSAVEPTEAAGSNAESKGNDNINGTGGDALNPAVPNRNPGRPGFAAPGKLAPDVAFARIHPVWLDLVMDQQKRLIMNQHNTAQTPLIRPDRHLVHFFLHIASRVRTPEHISQALTAVELMFGFQYRPDRPITDQAGPALVTGSSSSSSSPPPSSSESEVVGIAPTAAESSVPQGLFAAGYDSTCLDGNMLNRILTLCLSGQEYRRGLAYAHQTMATFQPTIELGLSNFFMLTELFRKQTAEEIGLNKRPRREKRAS